MTNNTFFDYESLVCEFLTNVCLRVFCKNERVFKLISVRGILFYNIIKINSITI